MTYQLATAKIWDGTQWVAAAGGGGSTDNWTPVYKWASGTVNAIASSTIHTKGAWIEVVASTSSAVDLLLLDLNVAGSTTNTASLIDIGTGASGAETAIVSNIAFGSAGTPYSIPVLVYVPSGTRVSVRIQSIVASRIATVIVYGYSGPNPSGTSTTATVIGSDTATSIGTAMSGTNNTYVQLTASTAAAYQSLVLVLSANSNIIGGFRRICTLGKGASGSEIALNDVLIQSTTSETVSTFATPNYPPIVSVPSGTRLAVKMSTSNTYMSACIIATEVVGR